MIFPGAWDDATRHCSFKEVIKNKRVVESPTSVPVVAPEDHNFDAISSADIARTRFPRTVIKQSLKQLGAVGTVGINQGVVGQDCFHGHML